MIAAHARLLNAAGAAAGVHAQALSAACTQVIASGKLILGPALAAFEQELAAASQCTHAIGVANGTDAIELSLHALGIGAGDRVITVAHTAGATLRAILRVGALPVLVDIDPATYTMDVGQVRAALAADGDVRALLPVHLYGHPADMQALRVLADAHGIALVEDAAQAFGAAIDGRPVGGFGDCAALSFYPTKTLGALGDGGAVLTGRDDAATRLRAMRQYGWQRQPQYAEGFGINSRLDELQAAMLSVKLRLFADEQQRRAQLARRYREKLADAALTLPFVAAGVTHAWHQFVVRLRNRDAVRRWLTEKGLQLSVHYAVPTHRQPAYAVAQIFGGALPQTDLAASEVLSLPLHPHLLDDDVDLVCTLLKQAMERCG